MKNSVNYRSLGTRLAKLVQKGLCGVFAAALIMTSFGSTARASESENYEGRKDWYVHLTQDGVLDTNFKKNSKDQNADFDDVMSDLEPGDSALFSVDIENKNAQAADFYMENDIVRSMEDYDNNRATNGGAYSYRLMYYDDENPNGITLYDSSAVGGESKESDDRVGLNEATENLEDFFYLGTLASGKKGKVTLVVGIDGEAQNNAYQNTMAQLRMRFAVEFNETYDSKVEEGDDASPNKKTDVTPNNGGSNKKGVVKTGDDVNMMPYFIAAFISGLLLLIVCIFRFRDEKKKRGDTTRKGGA